MRAIAIPSDSGRSTPAEALTFVDRERPVPGTDQVLIRVHAIGINRADILQRKGLYPAPPGCVPDIPGLEFAGEIVETGSGVPGTLPSRVMGLVPGGAYAEFVVLDWRECIPVPTHWNYALAAAAPEGYLTAYDAIVRQCNVSRNEKVLVYAATGGVGICALQVVRAAEAIPYGVSRANDKLQTITKSVDFVPLHWQNNSEDDSQDNLVHLLREAGPFDVVFDTVSGPTLPVTLKNMQFKGRLALIGMLAGATANIPLGQILSKRLHIIGSVLRSRTTIEKIDLVQSFVSDFWPRLQSWAPVVDTVFDWQDVHEATRRMETGEHVGKIVLSVS